MQPKVQQCADTEYMISKVGGPSITAASQSILYAMKKKAKARIRNSVTSSSAGPGTRHGFEIPAVTRQHLIISGSYVHVWTRRDRTGYLLYEGGIRRHRGSSTCKVLQTVCAAARAISRPLREGSWRRYRAAGISVHTKATSNRSSHVCKQRQRSSTASHCVAWGQWLPGHHEEGVWVQIKG